MDSFNIGNALEERSPGLAACDGVCEIDPGDVAAAPPIGLKSARATKYNQKQMVMGNNLESFTLFFDRMLG